MSRDYGVYCRRKEPIGLDELLEAVQLRGSQLTCVQREGASSGEWTSAKLSLAPSRTDHAIDLSWEPMEAYLGEELLDELEDATKRGVVEQAATYYGASVGYSVDPARSRALVDVLNALAGMADGLILDNQTSKTYLVDELTDLPG